MSESGGIITIQDYEAALRLAREERAARIKAEAACASWKFQWESLKESYDRIFDAGLKENAALRAAREALERQKQDIEVLILSQSDDAVVVIEHDVADAVLRQINEVLASAPVETEADGGSMAVLPPADNAGIEVDSDGGVP
ncbi:MAG: hypothetical protein KGL39_36820 [Patescibacteria group bacterium]|nr:hypothetical protein [Patescibacteria group bacterium]